MDNLLQLKCMLLPLQDGSVSFKLPLMQVISEDPTRVYPESQVKMHSVPWATSDVELQFPDISGVVYVSTLQSAVWDNVREDT